jgi:hypothetical protein
MGLPKDIEEYLHENFGSYKLIGFSSFTIEVNEPDMKKVDILLEQQFDYVSVIYDGGYATWYDSQNELRQFEISFIETQELPTSFAKLVDHDTLIWGEDKQSYGHVKTFYMNFSLNKNPIEMTLYYRRTIPGTTDNNGINVVYATNPEYGPISQISNRYMCESDFVTPTNDIINFTSKRCPGNVSLTIPDMFLETVTIISNPYQTINATNMISAVANYTDSGYGSVTSVNFVNYSVTVARGKFSGYTNVKIIFDNGPEKKRTVYIT